MDLETEKVIASVKSGEGDEEEQQAPKYTDWVFPSIDILQEKEVQQQDENFTREGSCYSENSHELWYSI